mmetsp:Transcript_19685/g.66170  ORF Transcript_19685/g.66170 Transcript_19685/m.66170 type:complete len:536 (-) Transcript_19685:368-1975(-)
MFAGAQMPGSVSVLEHGAGEARGEHARMSTIIGALAIADVVKTSLGPKGMDKILQPSGAGPSQLMVTNDGATILKSILVDNPAAKVLIDISKTQDDEVGDGTTSVCVLAGELLRQAEKLTDQQLHPQLIVAGFRRATEAARAALGSIAVDHSDDPVKFREDLMHIAMTTLSSKVLSYDREQFAAIAVDAVMKLKGSTNLDQIQIIKKHGGTLRDSYLDHDGFLLNKKIGVGCPRRVEKAKILLANTPMDTDKVKIYGTKVKTDSMAKVAEIEAAERAKMNAKVDKIVAHGCNVFINRQLIYNLPEQRLGENGVMVIEHADFDGIAQLALVTRGDIVSTFDTPDQVTLGEAELIEEVMIGEDKLIRFSGVPNAEACSIVLRGANTHILDEAERSLHDALCVLSQTVKHTKVVPGGGACEMTMAQAIDEAAREVPGKQALAMEAFARGLRAMPEIIATNGGLDAADLVAKLKAKHFAGEHTWGLNMQDGGLADMFDIGIMESFKVKLHVLLSASEAAEMLLRVDNVVQCAPRQREGM